MIIYIHIIIQRNTIFLSAALGVGLCEPESTAALDNTLSAETVRCFSDGAATISAGVVSGLGAGVAVAAFFDDKDMLEGGDVGAAAARSMASDFFAGSNQVNHDDDELRCKRDINLRADNMIKCICNIQLHLLTIQSMLSQTSACSMCVYKYEIIA